MDRPVRAMNENRPGIVFLVPSLESGRDGVGDYAWRLGEALRERGWRVAWVALNDGFVDSETYLENDDMLRLAAGMAWSGRATALNRFIEEREFDWISLQWVGFGYEKHGLPWRLAQPIARARAGRRLHVFFHEIWLGEKPGLPLRHRLLGAAQRKLLLHALNRWQPDVMHTSNAVYREALARVGQSASILPLPGNLPIASKRADENPDGPLRIALFGSLDTDWNPIPFGTALEKWGELHQRAVFLLSVGNQGPGFIHWNALVGQFAGSRWLHLESTGFCEPEIASGHLLSAHVGATTKSFELLGKSGAFAALAEHGLPVIALCDPVETRLDVETESWPVPVLRFEAGKPERLHHWLTKVRRQAPASRLPTVTDRFIAELARFPIG